MKTFCTPLLLVFFTIYNPLNIVAQNAAPQQHFQKIENNHNAKLSKQLMQLYKDQSVRNATDNVAPNFSSSYPFFDFDNDYIAIDFVAAGSVKNLLSELNQLNFELIATYANLISGRLKISDIPRLGNLQHLRLATPAMSITHIGNVDTQGDTAQISELARQVHGFNGSGIKIGIISDSYNIGTGEATAIAAGELPGPGNPNGFLTPVNVLMEYSGSSAVGDEGRAMAEIVHDIAPGAEILFYTGKGGRAAMANAINQLRIAGCHIIMDDVGYVNVPYFQDGLLAQAADTAAINGALYFSASGNMGSRSYEYPGFNSNSNGNTQLHDFDPDSANEDLFQDITIPEGRTITIVLQWDEPWTTLPNNVGTVTNDLDLFLLDPTRPGGLNNKIVARGDDDNIDTGHAYEAIFSFTNPVGSGNTTFQIAIAYYQNISDAPPNFFKYIIYNPFCNVTIDEYATNSSTCIGQANAEKAIAVGAAAFYNTVPYGASNTTINCYSSTGGTPILFDKIGNPITSVQRQKPEIVGPDKGNTSFFGVDIPQDADTHPNFAGTSAATPHIAAATALLLNAGASTRADIMDTYSATAEDMDDPNTPGPDPGFDFGTGFGMAKVNDAITYYLQSLPVELVHFTARKVANRDVLLDWKTATEINNDFFFIQHAHQSNQFEPIAHVAGRGNSHTVFTYQKVVKDLPSGWNYFQLWQQDFDGHQERLGTEAVFIPAYQQTHYSYSEGLDEVIVFQQFQDSNYQLSVFSVEGKLMYTVDGQSEAEQEQRVLLPASQWPGGMYFYTIQSSNSAAMISGRFVK